MTDKEFAQKAFQDAVRASVNEHKDKLSQEETEAFYKEIASRSDAIMDASKMKVELSDKVDVDQLAKVVVLTGCKDAFVALTGTLMMICFHIGWKAGKGESEEAGK